MKEFRIFGSRVKSRVLQGPGFEGIGQGLEFRMCCLSCGESSSGLGLRTNPEASRCGIGALGVNWTVQHVCSQTAVAATGDPYDGKDATEAARLLLYLYDEYK